jgi:hypothetical protein
VVNGEGEIRVSVKYFYMGVNSVNKICTSLGMTPLSQLKIGILRQAGAVDVAAAIAAHGTETEDAEETE